MAAPSQNTQHKAFKEIVSYIFVGLIATSIYFSLGFAIVHTFNIPTAPASSIAFICSTTFSYFAQKNISFRSKNQHRYSAPRFMFSAFIGLVISFVLPLVLVNLFNAPAFTGFLGVAVVVTIISYTLQKYWVFSAHDNATVLREKSINRENL